jgi:Cytochrome c554 and c-prime
MPRNVQKADWLKSIRRVTVVLQKSRLFWAVPIIISINLLASCSTNSGNNEGTGDEGVSAVAIPAAGSQYIVLAWNDLGMHCLNPTYDKEVILPPYNTVWAQVIKRGNPPQIVTAGLRLEYSILNNTYSYGKRSYGQFWDNCMHLFGVNLARDTGLNLEDPNIHNSLSGTMVVKGNHFQVNGIPVTPVNDSGTWNPLQIAEIVVKDNSSGAELAKTRATVPASDEINCYGCHGQGDVKPVLEQHSSEKPNIVPLAPVLCASCHGSPALGQTTSGMSGTYLSEAIHGFHKDKNAACYDCHPGATTQCNRSNAHTAADGNCTACHGSMGDVASSISSGSRVPWSVEPKCAKCHIGIAEVDTGTTLYRNSSGHHGLSCPACHGSPHAMVPSKADSDNYQAKQYQNKALALGSCRVCHPTSKGGGLDEFMEAHGGSRATACSVCHTAIGTNNPENWPHKFQQKSR